MARMRSNLEPSCKKRVKTEPAAPVKIEVHNDLSRVEHDARVKIEPLDESVHIKLEPDVENENLDGTFTSDDNFDLTPWLKVKHSISPEIPDTWLGVDTGSEPTRKRHHSQTIEAEFAEPANEPANEPSRDDESSEDNGTVRIGAQPRPRGVVARYQHACKLYKKEVKTLPEVANGVKQVTMKAYAKSVELHSFMKAENDYKHIEWVAMRKSRTAANTVIRELRDRIKKEIAGRQAAEKVLIEKSVSDMGSDRSSADLQLELEGMKQGYEAKLADLRLELDLETAAKTTATILHDTTQKQLEETRQAQEHSESQISGLADANSQLKSKCRGMAAEIEALQEEIKTRIALATTKADKEIQALVEENGKLQMEVKDKDDAMLRERSQFLAVMHTLRPA